MAILLHKPYSNKSDHEGRRGSKSGSIAGKNYGVNVVDTPQKIAVP